MCLPFLTTLLFTTPALADIAPEEPAEEPSSEASSEETEDDSDAEEEEDIDEDSKGCNSVRVVDLGAVTFPSLCLGALALFRREQSS